MLVIFQQILIFRMKIHFVEIVNDIFGGEIIPVTRVSNGSGGRADLIL